MAVKKKSMLVQSVRKSLLDSEANIGRFFARARALDGAAPEAGKFPDGWTAGLMTFDDGEAVPTLREGLSCRQRARADMLFDGIMPQREPRTGTEE